MFFSPLLTYDLIIFLIELLIAVSSLYSAWVNLVKKHISNIGFDAFVLLFFNQRKAMVIRRDPRTITRIGVMTLLVGIGGIIETAPFFIQRIWPYFH